jgi:putative peptidoglycan lipid II flippase
VTRPAVPVTQDGQEPGVAGIVGTGIGRAAALIAGLTILARLLGLVRTIVFAKTVGATCLGTAYVTANALPNIIYDIVLGGALTSIMVPVLARPARRSPADAEAAGEVRQISSALLTWTILILAPVSLAIALLAGPLATVLNPVNSSSRCAQGPLVTVTGHMLTVFAPQILLYGLAVVLYGILQAHRKFAAPALAPVISSLVLIAIYVAFVPLGAAHVNTLGRLSTTAELTLSVGTTVGVAALLLTALIPAWRLRLRLRPALRFPAGVGRQVGGLALFGIVALVAQDLAQLVVILLANGRGPHAAFVLYQYGWQVFEAAYAVLAISIAVSAFPVLSAREGEDFDQTASGSARAVLLMSFLGTALMFAVAIPAAHFLAAKHGQIPELAVGLALFAPGLAGYGLVACLSRVLLAARHTRVAAIAVGGGWLLVVVADIVLVGLAPARWVVGMLALGSSIGLTAAGVALVVAVRRALGPAALAGTGRAAAAGLAAAVTGGGVGALISSALPISNPVVAALVAAFAAGCAVAGFALVAYVLDGGELRAVVTRVRQALAR